MLHETVDCTTGEESTADSDGSAAAMFATLQTNMSQRLALLFAESFPAFLRAEGHAQHTDPFYRAAEDHVLGDVDAFLDTLLRESEAALRLRFRVFELSIGLREQLLRRCLEETRGVRPGTFLLPGVMVMAELTVLGGATSQDRMLQVYHPDWGQTLAATVYCSKESRTDGCGLAGRVQPWVGIGLHAAVATALFVEDSWAGDTLSCLLTEDCSWLPAPGEPPCVITLHHWISQRDDRLADPRCTVAAILGVARGLEAAHRACCAHDHVSACCVLVVPGSNADTVQFKLTDFGVPTPHGLLDPPVVSPTPEDPPSLSRRMASDVFALALLLLDVIRGRLLDDSDYKWWFTQRNNEFVDANRSLVSVSLARSGLPEALLSRLRPLLLSCLCTERWEERPSAEFLASQLQTACSGHHGPHLTTLRPLGLPSGAPGNTANQAAADFRAGRLQSPQLCRWVKRVFSGAPATLFEVINALLMRWRMGYLDPREVLRVLQSLCESTNPTKTDCCFSPTVHPPLGGADVGVIDEVQRDVLREGGGIQGDGRLTTVIPVAGAHLTHSRLCMTSVQSLVGGASAQENGYRVGLVVGDALACTLHSSECAADDDPGTIFMQEDPWPGRMGGSGSPGESPRTDDTCPPVVPGSLLADARTSGGKCWWCRDLTHDLMLCSPGHLGREGELLFTIGQFLISFEQTIFVHVVIGIEVLPGPCGDWLSFVLLLEGNNSSPTRGAFGEADDANSDAGDEVGYTNRETSPSVESDGEGGVGDPQYDLQHMYQPEYYACYGRVGTAGGALQVTQLQRIQGVSPDQRVAVMHAIPSRREVALGGTGGLVGMVSMVAPGCVGCCTATVKYLCNNVMDLMHDSAPTAPHSFDSAVGSIASHPPTGLLLTGDSAGVLCAWRWVGSREVYTVVSVCRLPSRVEALYPSPGGMVVCVTIARQLLLVGFSHARPDIRPHVQIGFGSLYVRAVLDTEPTWSTRTTYSCEFLPPLPLTHPTGRRRGLGGAIISVWKCAIESNFPAEMRMQHWLYPNVEHAEHNFLCTLRRCPVDCVASTQTVQSVQEVCCTAVSDLLQQGLVFPAVEQVGLLRGDSHRGSLWLKYCTRLMCLYLDAMLELRRVGADTYVLRRRNMRRVAAIPLHSDEPLDHLKFDQYLHGAHEAALGESARRQWFSVRLARVAIDEEFTYVSGVVSVGLHVAAALFKAESLADGVVYAVRVYDMHSTALLSHHTLTPSVNDKLNLFLYDEDYLLHADVTALALCQAGTHLCCALSSRLSPAAPSVLHVYARENWNLLRCIRTDIGPVTFLRWNHLDHLLLACCAGVVDDDEPPSRTGHVADGDEDDDGESSGDDCRSVLHRLGHLIFARRHMRRTESVPSPPRPPLADRMVRYNPARTALFFLDWSSYEAPPTLLPTTQRSFSDDADTASTCGSGHDTPPAYHSSPPQPGDDSSYRCTHALSTTAEPALSPLLLHSSPVIDLYPSPGHPSFEERAPEMSTDNCHRVADIACGDVIPFDVMMDRYIPFVSRRNASAYVAAELRSKQRRIVLSAPGATDPLDCLPATQAFVDSDKRLDSLAQSVKQWLALEKSHSSSGLYVVDVPPVTDESADVSVWALADAFLNRQLSSYLQLGPPFCWAHSFSKSYNVIMIVGHQLAALYGSRYTVCVVNALASRGAEVLAQHLSASTDPVIREWGQRFEEDLLQGLIEMHRRILVLDFLLSSWENENRVSANWCPSPGEAMPTRGDINIPSGEALQQLRVELDTLSYVQKSIQLVDCASWTNCAAWGEEAPSISGHRHAAVPTMTTLCLEDIYDIYICRPILALVEPSTSSRPTSVPHPGVGKKPALDLVVQIEIGVLRSTPTASSMDADNTASSSLSGELDNNSPEPISEMGSSEASLASNAILRIDTSEEGGGGSPWSIATAGSGQLQEPGREEDQPLGDAEDSVVQTTAFLLYRLSELAEAAPGFRVVVFSNLQATPCTTAGEGYPVLLSVVEHASVMHYKLPVEPPTTTLRQICGTLLQQRGLLGQSVRSMQVDFTLDELAVFVQDKVCAQSVEYAQYMWDHLHRHCGPPSALSYGGVDDGAALVGVLDRRAFDDGFFFSLFTRLHQQTGPAYSSKRWFDGVRPVLEVNCAALQPPPLSLLSSALDMQPAEVWSVLTLFLPSVYTVSPPAGDGIVVPFHPRLTAWLTDPARCLEPFYVDTANGHNYFCALYLRHCGNKSIAVDHEWQDYLRVHGPVHLRLCTRGLMALTSHIRKIDETSGIKGILPHQIGFISGLKELYARRVGLSGVLPVELGLLKHLRVLSMGNNHLHGPLPKTLGHLTRLQRIVLHQNRLSGVVPAELSQLECIVNLAGNPNLMHGPDVPAAERQALGALFMATQGDNWVCKAGWRGPNAVSSWYKVGVLGSHVHSIVMSSNNMVGSLPPAIAELKHLRMVELATMPGLGGTLSKHFCELVNLRRLCICRCALRGPIPHEIGQLVQLEELQLFGNSMTGAIPDSIRHLVNLRLLSLGEYTGGNNFAPAVLPRCISALVNLEALFMANCNVIGQIPGWLGHLPELRQLDLQRNSITGTLPETLSLLSNLLYLNVKDNLDLGGSIPLDALSKLTKLNRLSLVHCSFNEPAASAEVLQGRLPRCRIWI